MIDEKAALKTMAELIKGPHPLDSLIRFGRRVPEPWKSWTPQLWFENIRCMLQTTQDQIAGRSGLDQSVVSRLEGGFDARLSSWRRAYDALGFDLVLLPVARYPHRRLRERADEDRATDRFWRQHARPRRRWKEYWERRRAEREAAQVARERTTASKGRATAPSGTPPGPSSPPR